MLERRFGAWIATAGYPATRSANELTGLEQNGGDMGEGCRGRQLFQKFSRTPCTRLFGSPGTAKYDAVETKLQRRFSNGFQMNLAYTCTHGRGWKDKGAGDTLRFFDIPRFYCRNYSDLNPDIRQDFPATAICDLPSGRGKPHLMDSPLGRILGGWQLNGLFSACTGSPFSVSANNSLNPSSSCQIAGCCSESRYLKEGGNGLWIDSRAFTQPPGTRFGNCGPNSVRRPGLVDLDLGIFRKFRLSEQYELQFRAEGFNIASTPHFERPNGRSITPSSFVILNRVRNTGPGGIDARFSRIGLSLGW